MVQLSGTKPVFPLWIVGCSGRSVQPGWKEPFARSKIFCPKHWPRNADTNDPATHALDVQNPYLSLIILHAIGASVITTITLRTPIVSYTSNVGAPMISELCITARSSFSFSCGPLSAASRHHLGGKRTYMDATYVK